MIGEREDFNSETNYGSLVMRSYSIDGNDFNAFYDSSDNLIFVMDNTVNTQKPNVLLVINPNADKKWDEILSGDYGVDLETIRPKVDNKYQKLDIEYSGLPVYDNLIKAYNAGDSLEEPLNQLLILRASAARHSAMTRLNAANEVIAKTNATIVKTKESIVRAQARLKTLRAKLAEAKKGIGREPTKQSASKILKLESQIDATNEKLKRAQERLKSAQKRLEIATVDAELASNLLNQPADAIKQTTKKAPVIVAAVNDAPVAKVKKEEPVVETKEITETVEEVQDYDDDVSEEEIEEENVKEEETVDSEKDKIKPLFNEDPQILNEDIAFKPISFDAAAVPELSAPEKAPDLDKDMIHEEEITETVEEEIPDDPKEEKEEEKEEKPVLESMMPVPLNESLPEPSKEHFEKEESEPVEEIKEETTEEIVEEPEQEPLKLEIPKEDDARQQEPVFAQELDDIKEEPVAAPMPPVSPITPVAPVTPISPLPYSASNISAMQETEVERKKPSFLYYLLLVVLIVLSIFTLWLYQRSVDPTAPVLTASVERTEVDNSKSFFKKTEKSRKKVVVKEIEDKTTFLDETPVKKEKPEVIEPVVVVDEDVEDIDLEPVNVAPLVTDAVPERVMTSGQEENVENTGVSEEDILASKPVFVPGSRHEEMFVAEEFVEDVEPVADTVEYVEVETDEDIIYAPENEEGVEYIEEVDDPYFDAEEAAYQAEQYEE